jgi:hypothetical protein
MTFAIHFFSDVENLWKLRKEKNFNQHGQDAKPTSQQIC